MDTDIRQYIDYYLQNRGTNELVYTSSVAVIISFIALLTSILLYLRQRKNQIYDRLSISWNNIVNTSAKSPQFFNINVTEHYYSKMSKTELISYEPFCLMVWGLVEEIISFGFHKHNEFAPVLQWAIAYHISWLDRNPLFFRKNEFWTEIDNLRTQPQSIARHSPAPMHRTGELNWNEISNSYFEYILSPFDDLMFNSSKIRSEKIISDIASKIEMLSRRKESITLMDLGCGIGNLYPHLSLDICKKIKLIGVDKSKVALEKARESASNKFKEAIFDELDFTEDITNKYRESSVDIIVCISSLSLPNLELVNKAINNIDKLLKNGGILVALLPSFEAVEEWLDLWIEYYKKEYGEEQALRIKKSWLQNKKFDKEKCTYAEDGSYSQCFFTMAMINDLFSRYHGITLTQEPEKIYYPWELIKRFDYGVYDNTSFELYDWHIVGKKK